MRVLTCGILTSIFFDRKGERLIFGGGERYLVELAKFLQSEGFEVRVIQAAGEEGWEKTYDGVKIIGVPRVRFELETSRDLNAAFAELMLDADLRIYFAPFLCWPKVIRPCIAVSHGIWWDFPEHTYFNASGPTAEEWRRRVRFGLTEPDLIVSVDANTRNVAAAMWPGAASRIMVIPNFVDTEVFRPREGPRTWERFRVLFPRRLSTLRGINETLRAAEKLPNVDFIFCGRSHRDDEEASMLEFARGTENCRYLWQPMEDMPEVYREADVAVIPTRAAEGTSLSCLEAMASGLPVIATPAGGLAELVIDRYNGLVVDLNFERLETAIGRLAMDLEACQVMGRRGREMAETSFSLRLWRARWRKALEWVL